jgi:hypothetical protein
VQIYVDLSTYRVYFILGSVHAITQDGKLVVASATASQIGPCSNTAGKVILVVGSQKIVPDLETAIRRIRDYVCPGRMLRCGKPPILEHSLAKFSSLSVSGAAIGRQ